MSSGAAADNIATASKKNAVFSDISVNKLWRGQAWFLLSVDDPLDILGAVFKG